MHFTDPHPPQLFRSAAQYTASSAPEPVVWLPVLDLFTEKPEACATARDWTLQAIRDAMTPVSNRRMELVYADLSPSCTQAPDRSVDVPSLQQEIRAAIAAFPSAHVRVVLVYANDIALEVPGQVVDALHTLRQAGFLWMVARDPTVAQLGADKVVPWTFISDPALRKALSVAATQDLPLQTDVIDPAPKPILGRDDLGRARELKLCSASPQVAVQNLAPDGSASLVRLDLKPVFFVSFTPRYAVPKSKFTLQHAELEVEGCSADCDRYFTGHPGDLRRWDATRGCLLEGS